MKKIVAIIFVIIIFVCSTGCLKKDVESDSSNIINDTNISENNSYEYVTVQNAYKMENIPNTEDFDTSSMVVAEKPIGKIYKFTINIKNIIPQSNIIELFKTRVKENVGANYNEDGLQVMSVKDAKTGEFIGESRAPLSLYEEQIISGEYKYVMLVYEQMDEYDKDYNLVNPYYGLNCLVTGDMMNEIKGGARHLYKVSTGDYDGSGGLIPVISFPETKRLFKAQLNKQTLSEKIALADGEVTIGEIIARAEKYIAENIIYSACDFNYSVTGVTVTNLGNGKQGISLTITPSYENIPFLTYNSRSEGVAYEGDHSLRGDNFYYYSGEIAYIQTNSPDTYTISNIGYIEGDKTEIDRIISLEKVLNKINEEKAPELKLSVRSAALKYTYGYDEKICYPVWEIVCTNKALADNDAYVYVIDAISGETDMSIYSSLELFK